MKKETQVAIREAIVDWLSTHRLMQGEFEILKRYVRQFYDISLYDITEEALVSLWKNSGENKALRMGAYCMEDFWDWGELEMMPEHNDVTTRETPFSYTISGIPEEIVVTYKLVETK